MASALASLGRFVERVDGCVPTRRGDMDPDIGHAVLRRACASHPHGELNDPARLAGHEKATGQARKSHAAASDGCRVCLPPQ